VANVVQAEKRSLNESGSNVFLGRGCPIKPHLLARDQIVQIDGIAERMKHEIHQQGRDFGAEFKSCVSV